MKLLMIRHGATPGNLEHRYVGSTDESLCENSMQKLKELKNIIDTDIFSKRQYEIEQSFEEHYKKERDIEGKYEKVKCRIIISPMKRCRETAEILFPEEDLECCDKLKECNFGDFEYKNYEQLNGNEDYQKYIDSNGVIGFPNGESRAQFAKRCVEGFEEIIELYGKKSEEIEEKVCEDEQILVLVVHGGTIMALLDHYSNPHGDYFDWQIGNAAGYYMDMNFVKTTGKVVLENISRI